MNTLHQLITASLGLALSVSMISCEKEGLLTPKPISGARLSAEDEITLPSPGLPQVHRLTKYGNSTLLYTSDGHLQKVTTAVNRGGVDYYTDYTYAPGTIRAVSYQGAYLVRDEIFTLNATGGRCTESVVKSNTGETHWVYTYNAKGQLSSCQNKNSCVGGVTYTYNTDGDLVQATVATSLSHVMKISFSYVLPADQNYAYETYPLNLNIPLLPEHDTFLPIFGRTGKHLVKRVAYSSPSGSTIVAIPSDRFYSYMIPSDGYVVDRTMSYTFGGSSVEKIHYEYELADIGLH